MSHDKNNPFSNETGEYLQELTEINHNPAPVKAEKEVDEEPVEVKPRRSYKRQGDK